MDTLDQLAGQIRRFGIAGPLYQIVGAAAVTREGADQARIRLIDSGEEVDYPVTALVNDPLEL